MTTPTSNNAPPTPGASQQPPAHPQHVNPQQQQPGQLPQFPHPQMYGQPPPQFFHMPPPQTGQPQQSQQPQQQQQQQQHQQPHPHYPPPSHGRFPPPTPLQYQQFMQNQEMMLRQMQNAGYPMPPFRPFMYPPHMMPPGAMGFQDIAAMGMHAPPGPPLPPPSSQVFDLKTIENHINQLLKGGGNSEESKEGDKSEQEDKEQKEDVEESNTLPAILTQIPNQPPHMMPYAMSQQMWMRPPMMPLQQQHPTQEQQALVGLSPQGSAPQHNNRGNNRNNSRNDDDGNNSRRRNNNNNQRYRRKQREDKKYERKEFSDEGAKDIPIATKQPSDTIVNSPSSPPPSIDVENMVSSIIDERESEENKADLSEAEIQEIERRYQAIQSELERIDKEKQGEHNLQNTEQQKQKEVVYVRDRSRKVPKNLKYGAPVGIKKSELTLPPNKIPIINTQLIGIFNTLRPPRADFEKRLSLIGKLQTLVSNKWPKENPKLHLFGSSANDFCLRRGDVDICLTINETAGSRKYIVNKLSEMLKRVGMKKILPLIHARVPIVKFFDPMSNSSCDICINNLLALKNTRLLADYSKIDPRVRHLVYTVKYWSKRRLINEPYRGTLSSYAYVLMVLHFLQQRKPPILPCLQQLKPGSKELLDRGIDGTAGWTELQVEGYDCAYFTDVDKLIDFGKDNKETPAELLERFFHFFTYEFDYHSQVLSVRTGGFLRKEEKNWVQATQGTLRDNYYLAIEDPFEITHNLGRVVDKEGLRTIRYEFKRAHYELCTTGSLHEVCKQYSDNEVI